MSDTPCICMSLRDAARLSTAFYDAALAPAGLKVTMYRLLKVIAARPGISISDLARAVGLDRSTLGRNLRVVERQGLVVFCGSQDGRTRAVTLTRTGEATLAKAIPHWQDAQVRMSAALGPDLTPVLNALRQLGTLEPQSTEAANER